MEFSKEQLALIKKTCVPKNANQEHIDQFLYVASKYDLDPLTKEVVLDVRVNRKTGERRAVIITTRDGYLKIAMASPDYNGVNGGVIREGDIVETDPIAGLFKHNFAPKRGRIIAAWAVAKAKGRDPIICIADYDEYSKANATSHTWQDYPSAMIQKVAEIMAMKRQFNINGLVTEEEISTGLLDNGTVDKATAETPVNEPAEKNPSKPAEKPAEPTKPAEKPAEKPASKPAEKPASKPAEKPAEKPVNKPAEKPAEPEKAEASSDEFINIVIMKEPIGQTEAGEIIIRGVVFLDEPGELDLVVPAQYKELLVDGVALLATGAVQDGKFIVKVMKSLEEAELSGEFIKLLSEPKTGSFVHKGERITSPWAYVEYQGKENIFAVGKALAGFNKGDTLAVNISDSITKDGKVMLFIESASRLEQAVR
jgi:phage recombination protein Bet